ncbi:DEKNAAC103542 [Brettanomyces naardenensis]|uniref:Glycylpeptide N-tetradecanoyltransferase n=1 Tax=Brettanomyces naardenensis TaxID=13370 RepID=A0A448YNN2_BRENA|nr:DEKNAAC103542 [Brettanomyces naardenensis]
MTDKHIGDLPSHGAPSKSIADLLQKLSLGEELTADQKKEMKDYKFWKTQPVPKLDESVLTEGPIEKDKKVEDIPSEPYPILSQFEWVTLDLSDEDDMDQLYKLLYEHYVEDHDSTFRFAYSRDFFNWALKPPGWREDWHVGVRVKGTKRLVAFISGVPATLRVRDQEMKAVEINFLCVHKKLRNKRLTPVLIKEITRRVNRCGIWQALYTSGTLLPSPVSTCRYTHRPLNWEKLYDVGFSALPEGVTKSQMLSRYALPSSTKTKGLRKMEEKDVEDVLSLYSKFQSRFDMSQVFSKEELSHWLLGDANERSHADDKRVVLTYVVENDEGRITDFVSFYVLPFTVIDNARHDKLGVAYLYYYATEEGLDGGRFDPASVKVVTKRLESLISDALVLAKNIGMDVFNALTSQDNVLFLDDLKFGPGDGFLNYYLFNYKAYPISGGVVNKEYDMDKRSGVGVVML